MSFFEILKAEAKAVFSDTAIVLTIIGGVILYSFLYPQPYLNEAVSELDVVVIDHDNSDVTRRLKFMMQATPQIKISHEVASLKEARKLLVDDVVKGIIVFDKHFTRDLYLGQQPNVAIAADASYFLILGAILEGASKAVLTEAATFKVGRLMQESLPYAKAKEAYSPYVLKTINLFNVHNSYTQYVIPAVFIIILQQTMLIGLGILGGRDMEGLNHETINAPVSAVIAARLIIFITVFFVHAMFYFGFSFEFFNVSHLANMSDLVGLTLLFLLSSALLGLSLGALFPNREMATPIILFSSLPLVFSAGFVWPIETLPSWIISLSLFFPSTPAIQGFLQLNQMGAPLEAISIQTGVLGLQIVLYGLLAYLLLVRARGKIQSH